MRIQPIQKAIAAFLLLTLALALVPSMQESAKAASNYYIEVDITNQHVTVYRTSDGAIVRQMICSTGASSTPTPTGTFTMPKKRYSSERTEWYATSGCYVKYASRIVNGILFHSILYNSRSESSLNKTSVTKLGSQASHGCVRLRVADSKWIAMNCPPGTKVKIFKSGRRDDMVRQLLKEQTYSIDSGLSYEQYACISSDPDTLSRASSGPEVLELEKRLKALGFFAGEPDGKYDSQTILAVRAFQEAAGLPATGMADPATRAFAAREDAPTGTRVTFSIGMSGPAVQKLQETMLQLKLYSGPIDGVYSQALADAVKIFQSANAMDADGSASEEVQLAALASLQALREKFGDQEYQALYLSDPVEMARVKVSSSLKLRKSASTSASSLASLKNGTEVLVLSRGATWSKVQYGAKVGYLKNSYLVFFTRANASLHYGTDLLHTPEDILSMQENLISLGFLEGPATGVYDRKTLEAVQAFQLASGKEADGIAGAATLEAASRDDAPTGSATTLAEGLANRAVKSLQRALQSLKFYSGEIDGVFDAEVSLSLIAFQKSYGYPADGVATPRIQNIVSAKAAQLKERFGDQEYGLICLESAANLASVKSGTQSLYEKSSTSSKKLESLAKGAEVVVLSKGRTWSKVRYAETTGYMKTSVLSFYQGALLTPAYGEGYLGDAAQILEMQKNLISLGFLEGPATGVYDQKTFDAVKAFQVASGKESTGFAGVETLEGATAQDAPTSTQATLSEGLSGRAVQKLKQALKDLKLYSGPADESFDESVSAALITFQKIYGYPADGIATSRVQNAVFAKAAQLKEQFGDQEYGVVCLESAATLASVKSGTQYLYLKSSTSSAKLEKLSKGAEVAVLSKGRTWSKVRYAEITGYMKTSVLSFYQGALLTPTYGEGYLGDAAQILEMQKNLISLGFLEGPATGVYDQKTFDAVKAFQVASGKESTGFADGETLEGATAQDAPTSTQATLCEGSSGRAVQKLQQALKDLKLYSGEIDGVFGAEVAASVRAFQRICGYPEDGLATTAVQQAAIARAQALKEEFGDREYEGVYSESELLMARVKVNSSLNLRASASTKAKSLGKLKNGAEVVVLERGSSWSKVQYGETVGYLMNSYLRFFTKTVVDYTFAEIPAENLADALDPSATPGPEASPSTDPEASPSTDPEASPSTSPEASPSTSPEASPSTSPEASPSTDPEASPSTDPEASPSTSPEASPSADPGASPSADPEASPSADPGVPPSADPEASPSADPEVSPSTGAEQVSPASSGEPAPEAA